MSSHIYIERRDSLRGMSGAERSSCEVFRGYRDRIFPCTLVCVQFAMEIAVPRSRLRLSMCVRVRLGLNPSTLSAWESPKILNKTYENLNPDYDAGKLGNLQLSLSLSLFLPAVLDNIVSNALFHLFLSIRKICFTIDDIETHIHIRICCYCGKKVGKTPENENVSYSYIFRE